MRILLPPMDEELQRLCASARTELIIVSPWIKKAAVDKYIVGQVGTRTPKYLVLMRGDIADFLSGSSDISAVEQLLEMGADIRLVSNLHAKIYIVDRVRAIITSSNLTPSGFEDNVELGVFVEQSEEIARLIQTIQEWFNQSKPVTDKWLLLMKGSLEEKSKEAKRLNKRRVHMYSSPANIRLKGKVITLPKTKHSKSSSSHRTTERDSYYSYSITEVLSVPHNDGPYRVIPLNGKWKLKIMNWNSPTTESYTSWTNLIINFFHLAFKWLPSRAFALSYLDMHKHCISITLGGQVLAGLRLKKGHPHLGDEIISNSNLLLYNHALESKFDYDVSLTSSTGITVGSVKYPLPKVISINTSSHYWDNYAWAVDKLYYSLSNNLKGRQIQGITLQDVWHEPFICLDEPNELIRRYSIPSLMEPIKNE